MIKNFNSSDIINSKELNKNFINANSKELKINCNIYNGNFYLDTFNYFVIDESGNVGQNFPLNKWGYHAGKSYYDGLGTYISNRVVGIEVICPGHLDSRRTAWFDRTKPFPEDKCRLEKRKNKNIAPGYYYKFTEEQENSLTKLLLWLWDQYDCFQVPYILGHDEVSPSRKVDPGGSLSMPMPEYRTKILSSINSS